MKMKQYEQIIKRLLGRQNEIKTRTLYVVLILLIVYILSIIINQLIY